MSAHSVSVTRGYPIRAELQARGYWFRRPNWKRRFATAEERAQEIAWIEASGLTLGYETAQPENRRKERYLERSEI